MVTVVPRVLPVVVWEEECRRVHVEREVYAPVVDDVRGC